LKISRSGRSEMLVSARISPRSLLHRERREKLLFRQGIIQLFVIFFVATFEKIEFYVSYH
jgi:hypothetical protein